MNWLDRGWEVTRYAVTSAVVSLWRHRAMTGATVLTTAVMLLMLNIFVVLVSHLNVALAGLERRVNVIAYVRDDAPPSEVVALRDQLRQSPDVLDVIYVTKEAAMARLREHFADRQELLAMVPGNPLPASLEIRARNPSQLSTLVATLRTSPVLEEVALQEDVVDRMLRLTTAARAIGFVMTVGLGLVTLFIVVNTIRLAV